MTCHLLLRAFSDVSRRWFGWRWCLNRTVHSRRIISTSLLIVRSPEFKIAHENGCLEDLLGEGVVSGANCSPYSGDHNPLESLMEKNKYDGDDDDDGEIDDINFP